METKRIQNIDGGTKWMKNVSDFVNNYSVTNKASKDHIYFFFNLNLNLKNTNFYMWFLKVDAKCSDENG